MKLIYLIAGTYRPAGMERVLANKANWLSRHGYDILVVTTDQMGREPAFRFEPGIRHIDLGVNYEENNGGSFADKLLHYPLKQIRHRRHLSRLLRAEKADVVVSMFCNDAAFLPKIKDGSHKVLEIHFSRFKRLQYARSGLWALADRLRSANDARIVRRFEKFVVLTREDRGYWGDMPNITVIPNAQTFTCPEPATLDSRQVLAVGRYAYQKGMERLLDAWKAIPEAIRVGWTLRIAGDGECRPQLEAQALELGISGSVIFGQSDDMLNEYMNSSIVALSSRYEGLPMVLIEAQSAGLPIVTFTCKCGPLDVVTDGVDGLLVPEGDVVSLAEKLGLLMSDAAMRKRMGAAAYKAGERYAEEAIMRQWTDLFEGL